MNKHDGMIRGFHHLNSAWYAEACKTANRSYEDQVMIGFYHENGEGGTTGEFAVEWHKLYPNDPTKPLAPCLCVYDDAWEALSHFSDLLAAMALLDHKDPTPEQFCSLLVGLGMKNITPRVSPYAAKEETTHA